MRSFLFFLSLLCATATFAQPSAVYGFRYDTTGARPKLIVTLRVPGDSSGRTTLLLPDRFASQGELWRAVTRFEVLSGGVRMDTAANPAQRKLIHKPGMDIVVRYEMHQDWEGPYAYPMNYRAALQRTWLQATGYSLLVRRDWPKETSVHLTLDWRGLPASWTVANSFSAGRRFNGTVRAGELENAFFLAGDHRMYARKVGENTIYTAIRGAGWGFADTALVSKAVRIIAGERDFWNDHAEKHFLVSLVPFEDGKGFNLNGSALHQAFFMGMTPDSFATANIHTLLAHEYMHRWIGNKLQLEGREEEQYWFSEGFTEYYSFKVLERLGIMPLRDYLSAVNRTVRDYYLSPVRNASQKDAADSFWIRTAFQRLPYTKGFAMAMYFDTRIQQLSNGSRSLDDVLFALNKSYDNSRPIAVKDLLASLQLPEADSLYRRWVLEGGTVSVLPLRKAQAFPMVQEHLGTFELGFAESSVKKGATIADVIEGSAAWDAGVRNGQVVQSMSIYFDDISKPVELTVLDNGTVRKFSYLPLHRNRVSVPQYSLGRK